MNTLLIANRGEIALRVMRTARRLGWRTVAIHTDLDADAPHVRAADRTVRVASYLDIDEVVAAAREAGAGFVHPGYGFLSERAPFARALADAGITLVGPSADVMDAMGRKDAAREVALAAGVPVVPSYSLVGPDAADPATFAYPVLVKAAAGGGGKGMRVVRSADGYAEAFAAAQREALSSFGDDTILVEKYVESGRHIEVQVMGDAHGTVLHFFERDCSTQRRHQKVLEEAPAPTIGDEQRAAITSSAVALAQQCGYTGAGTVEFLLDNATGEFYFLEMNTRLQVEHPVTEEVVRVRSDDGSERVDLVELQLRVATGEPLGIEQSQVTLEGHAIEARVYAEDSFNGFLPQAGVATSVEWPGGLTAGLLAPDVVRSGGEPGEPLIRVDHALESGQEVSTAYDPMLGKVIAWGPDREAARASLVAALDGTEILGLTTNTGFLRTLVASEEFRGATIDTAWLDRNEVPRPSDAVARILAAVSLAPDASPPHGDGGPWRADGFRLGADPAPLVVQVDRPVAFGAGTVDGRAVTEPHAITAYGSPYRAWATVDGEQHGATISVTTAEVEVVHRGQRFVFERHDPFADHAAAAGDGTLLAPMPGTVLAVNVTEGHTVAEGETLGVMEAMKMELALKAPFAGTVTAVGAATGDLVKLGALLFVVEPDAGRHGEGPL
ncbi:acetyl/propionyl/methylcrotonyl-CoA carboxylase subunit alpha [Nocardioides ganghwensis]|jgi:acetyl-CoA/propionyl-CoA carboxylase biotin carboxyl carrier protein|uniref:ATP-grasp domain-containing protein n=1 Tax=Nocardioides ganghwensis TaxID=252230 RepID=A0A4Q2S953_9ACTN|nr:biotin carboxylase N-terminal domain-containing protein [Nocardioides ganghwensis]MBD3947310.1 ATP-grasp domain-containing protein [Nocardioides ganghwensis]RYC00259.1 ATP-grasp domain-containing protein [Nocardioides ganghwensis]